MNLVLKIHVKIFRQVESDTHTNAQASWAFSGSLQTLYTVGVMCGLGAYQLANYSSIYYSVG